MRSVVFWIPSWGGHLDMCGRQCVYTYYVYIYINLTYIYIYRLSRFMRNYWKVSRVHRIFFCVLTHYNLRFMYNNLFPLCVTTILLWRKWDYGCAWINKVLFAQNLAFVRAVSRPYGRFNGFNSERCLIRI